MALRVASYNIHGCIGRDGRYDPGRIRAVLGEMDADIIALQEVEVLKQAPDLLDYLAEGGGWRPLAGPTLLRETGQYGNAVLTRLPILHSERIDLSQTGREPRGALRVLLDYTHDGVAEQLELFATHLGLAPGERRRQIRSLLAQLRNQRLDAQAPHLSLLMGDLNEWFLWGRPLRWLRHHFQRSPAPATFPAGWPLLALDRIWLKPRFRLQQVEVWRSPLARRASDHLPLVARLD